MKSTKATALKRPMSAQMPHRAVSFAGSAGIGGTFRHLDQLYLRGFQQVCYGVQLVFLPVVNGADAGVDQHLEAMDAGSVRHIDVGVADRRAVSRRLRNRVDFRMDRPKAVLLDFSVRIARFVDQASNLP